MPSAEQRPREESVIARLMVPAKASLTTAQQPAAQEQAAPPAQLDVDMDDPPHGEYAPYPPSELGGSWEEVSEILACRPSWDEETVEELLRWGARPKLHRVFNSYEGPWYTRVRCSFVQPTGCLVENVWLPLSILKSEYASAVAHL